MSHTNADDAAFDAPEVDVALLAPEYRGDNPAPEVSDVHRNDIRQS